MEIIYGIIRFFQSGGVFMFPILVVAAVGAAIAIERYLTLTLVEAKNRSLWKQVQPLLVEGNFDQARELTSKDDSAMSRLLAIGLARQGAVRRREDIEIAMDESMVDITPQLEKRTHYLATFANLATLLGLLGTVSGLIHAFGAVATVNPADKANLLAASISEAMNCTAFGLMTAVPILLAHAFLQTKTSELVSSLEMAFVKFLNVATERQVAHARRGSLTTASAAGA
jgi:biopolymer transport protein ExbB